jgi:hypothetical protein
VLGVGDPVVTFEGEMILVQMDKEGYSGRRHSLTKDVEA